MKQKKFRFLTIEEVHVFLNACPGYAKPIFLTAIHTGLRRSELFRLEWEDIDFERQYVLVSNKETTHTKNYLNKAIDTEDKSPEIVRDDNKVKAKSFRNSKSYDPFSRE